MCACFVGCSALFFVSSFTFLLFSEPYMSRFCLFCLFEYLLGAFFLSLSIVLSYFFPFSRLIFHMNAFHALYIPNVCDFFSLVVYLLIFPAVFLMDLTLLV